MYVYIREFVLLLIRTTICYLGVGFNMRRSNARTVFKQALPSVDFDAVYKGQAMTRDQCMTLYTVSGKGHYFFLLICVKVQTVQTNN